MKVDFLAVKKSRREHIFQPALKLKREKLSVELQLLVFLLMWYKQLKVLMGGLGGRGVLPHGHGGWGALGIDLYPFYCTTGEAWGDSYSSDDWMGDSVQYKWWLGPG